MTLINPNGVVVLTLPSLPYQQTNNQLQNNQVINNYFFDLANNQYAPAFPQFGMAAPAPGGGFPFGGLPAYQSPYSPYNNPFAAYDYQQQQQQQQQQNFFRTLLSMLALQSLYQRCCQCFGGRGNNVGGFPPVGPGGMPMPIMPPPSFGEPAPPAPMPGQESRPGFFARVGQAGLTIGAGLLDGTGQVVGGVVNGAIEFGKGVWGAFTEPAKGIAKGVGQFFGGIGDGFGKLAKGDIVGAVGSVVGGAVKGVGSAISGIVKGATSVVKGTVNAVKSVASGVVNGVKSVAKSIGNAFKSLF